MYVLIDMDRLVFLRKHQDLNFLAEFAFETMPELSYGVEPCDEPGFLGLLTDLELKMLYKNTTGKDQSFYSTSLRAIFIRIVSGMPYDMSFKDGYKFNDVIDESAIAKLGLKTVINEYYPDVKEFQKPAPVVETRAVNQDPLTIKPWLLNKS